MGNKNKYQNFKNSQSVKMQDEKTAKVEVDVKEKDEILADVEIPEIEIVRFETEDILTTSGREDELAIIELPGIGANEQ